MGKRSEGERKGDRAGLGKAPGPVRKVLAMVPGQHELSQGHQECDLENLVGSI